MREMTADRSRRESASTTHLPFNIYLFQTLFQINFCSVPIFSSDLRSVYDHVIENDNFKMFFLVLDLLFVMKNIFVSISTYKNVQRQNSRYKKI